MSLNQPGKMLVFWLAVLVVAVGIYVITMQKQDDVAATSVSGEWLLSGDLKQPCAIMRQGNVLVIVNERGDLATGRMTGDSTLVVIKGEHWEPGATAELKDNGKSLIWRDGSIWKRR
jgi:hypothetical protein